MTDLRLLLAAAAAALTLAAPAFAHDGVHINDAYARSSSPQAPTGAVFFEIENHEIIEDRLLSVRTDAAERAELHTHKEDAAGVMQMLEITEGIPIAPGESHVLARGGDHVMLLGLKKPLVQGETVTLTLTFQNAGEVVVDVPVDQTRKPGDAPHDHKAMEHQTHNP